MRATRLSTQSQYSRIISLVREAQHGKPPIQRLADRYAVWFTPATLGVVAFSCIVTQSVDAVLAVLVVATPCPLILATPIAVIGGVNRAAKESIIVKSGAAVEQIGKGRVVVFDKTGTLTYGAPVIERVESLIGSEDEILGAAAAVEQYSSHPVAVALAKEGRERLGTLPPAGNVKEAPGQGVEGDVACSHITVGSQSFVEARIGREFDQRTREVMRDAQIRGNLVSFIARDGRPAGILVFSDRLRPGVPAMIQALRALGVEHTVMLTGDNRVNASTIAKEAGIERVEANLLPGQKVEEVKRLNQEYGSTIMVGDGINDAPALATATVGVAMGAHGAGISAEAADIVLLVDDVTKVSDGVAIGQRMTRIAKESIFFGIGASFVLMAIASFGFIPPAAGAVIQEALDVSVILNALRVR